MSISHHLQLYYYLFMTESICDSLSAWTQTQIRTRICFCSLIILCTCNGTDTGFTGFRKLCISWIDCEGHSRSPIMATLDRTNMIFSVHSLHLHLIGSILQIPLVVFELHDCNIPWTFTEMWIWFVCVLYVDVVEEEQRRYHTYTTTGLELLATRFD